MIDINQVKNQVHCVTNFHDLVSTPFYKKVNAICWTRDLKGDFSEIVNNVESNENIATLDPEELRELKLSNQGQLAREVLLNDLKILKEQGADPVLNLIKCYERDDRLTNVEIITLI